MALPLADDARAVRVQTDLLRAAGPTGRFARARSLSHAVITLARRALRARHPDASDEEIGLRFVELHYGRDLAERVRQHLRRRA